MNQDFLAVVETKRFLGREFLTWLAWRLEDEGGRIQLGDDVVQLALGDRLALRERAANGGRITLVDPGDMRPELGAALRRGKLLDRARISVQRGDRKWELSLDGGLLTYDSLRCPPLGPRDPAPGDDARAHFENDFFLRLADVEDVVGVLDRLFKAFCETRAASSWETTTLPAMRSWIAELA